MNIKADQESITTQLEYYKPIMKLCEPFKDFIYEYTNETKFTESYREYSLQKEVGINGYITYIVVRFMSTDEFKELDEEYRDYIKFLTKRKLQ
tara:strand:- start:181 stop:459 length:279 start_codon:yes stop_codon:yes gene_type:complete